MERGPQELFVNSWGPLSIFRNYPPGFQVFLYSVPLVWYNINKNWGLSGLQKRIHQKQENRCAATDTRVYLFELARVFWTLSFGKSKLLSPVSYVSNHFLPSLEVQKVGNKRTKGVLSDVCLILLKI